MNFNYLYKEEAHAQLDIENIGNFCLSLTNDLYKEYILIVQTDLGRTKIIQYGPINVDMDTPCQSIKFTYDEIDYNQNKICTIIDKALNGPSLITQATVMELEDVIPRIRNMVEYL